MYELSSSVKSEYLYSLDKFKPADLHPEEIFSEKDIFNAYYVLADFFLAEGEMVKFGILNFDMLSSAVSRQSVSFGKDVKWKDEFCKIATLVYGLDKDHAFQDGNKRTALLTILLGMHSLKRQITCKKIILETLLVKIAANEMETYSDFKRYKKKYGDDAIIYFIADFLRHNSRKYDYSFRSITFEEFNTKLKKYNVWLDNPSNGVINVYRKSTKKSIFSFRKKNIESEKVLQIGFPGWKRQVNLKAFKCVLKETHLSDEYGIDSKAFYAGNEPEYKLIEEYFEVLKRLKDK